MKVAPCRQDAGRADQVASRNGADEPRIEGAQQPADLVVFGQQAVHRREVRRVAAGFGHLGQRLAARILAHDFAHHMQTMGNERVFEFEYLKLQGLDHAGGVGPGRFGCGRDPTAAACA